METRNAPLLTLDEIFGSKDIPTHEIPVPEWGGNLRITELSAAEGMRLGKAMQLAGKDPQGLNFKILAACVVDADGKKIFEGSQGQAALKRLEEKNLKVVNRVADEAARHLGLIPKLPKLAEELFKKIKAAVLDEQGEVNPFVQMRDVLNVCEEFLKEEDTVKNA